MVTSVRLKQVLHYEPETGVFRWITGRNTSKIAGSPNRRGYIRIQIGGRNGREYYAHRLVWLYVHGKWPRNEIDHINGKVNDNRLQNLREATRSQNLGNMSLHKDSTSGLKGVYFHKKDRKWMARICKNHHEIYLGSFDDPIAAHQAYLLAANEIFGKFMRSS